MGIRIERAFTDIIDIYKPNSEVTDANRRVVSMGYDPTPVAVDVQCRIEPQSEISAPTEAGRSSHDIRITTDKLRVLIGEEIDDTYMLQLKTVGHPEEDSWFVVSGGAVHLNWRADTKIFYIKRDKRPNFKDPA